MREKKEIRFFPDIGALAGGTVAQAQAMAAPTPAAAAAPAAGKSFPLFYLR